MGHLQLVHSAARAAVADFGHEDPIDPMLQALLKPLRIIAPLPRSVRARALARARAAISDPRSAHLAVRSRASARMHSIDTASPPRRRRLVARDRETSRSKTSP